MKPKARLTTTVKLVFGLGDWGTSAAATARNVFWFVFLTNIVGLSAGPVSYTHLDVYKRQPL